MASEKERIAAALNEARTSGPIDTANHALVSRSAHGIMLLRPPLAGQVLSDDLALSIAAWLVAMVDEGPSRLPDVLRAICNT